MLTFKEDSAGTALEPTQRDHFVLRRWDSELPIAFWHQVLRQAEMGPDPKQDYKGLVYVTSVPGSAAWPAAGDLRVSALSAGQIKIGSIGSSGASDRCLELSFEIPADRSLLEAARPRVRFAGEGTSANPWSHRSGALNSAIRTPEAKPPQEAFAALLRKQIEHASSALGLPVPHVVDDEDGGFEIGFRSSTAFADIDIFEDGEMFASTGGRDRQPKTWRIEPKDVPHTLQIFRDHLGR